TRYLLRFPLWEDEAMLSANLLDRGYGELLRPLHYCQVAPTLFLWGQLAVAYPMTRYAAEAKPYVCDLLVALAMLALTIEWLRRPDQTRWLWCLAALVGPAVGYSYPAIFVAGGVSLVMAWVLVHGTATMHARRAALAALAWFPWIVYNVLLVASFATVL